MVGKSDQGLLLHAAKQEKRAPHDHAHHTGGVDAPTEVRPDTNVTQRKGGFKRAPKPPFSLRHESQHHHRETTPQTRPHTLSQEAPQRSKEQRDEGLAQGEGGRLCRMCSVGCATCVMTCGYVVLGGVVGCTYARHSQ